MILIDGQPDENVSARDRGLAYGDGVFRTLRVVRGQPLWWRDQAAKLAADCAALGLACPDESVLHDEVSRVAASTDCVVKIIITRGQGSRGYAPGAARPVRMVMAAALPDYAGDHAPLEVRARWCALRLGQQPRLAGIKHLNRLENVLARAEWDDPAIREGLLCDQAGHVISGVMSNLFWVKADVLHTPDLSDCGVAGVARVRLLRAAIRHGWATRIERHPAAAILDADEVMICNSLIGVRRIARIDATDLPQAGWRIRLEKALYEDLD